VTSDHLGSGDLILDSAANILARESFTPFGARRGSNWQGNATGGDYTTFQNTTRRGFTGHEMLDSVSLVHMNGRVYDPYVGRFLSPDPIIQTLALSQALNPFSYVMNNPLSLIDPSGYSWLSKLFRSVKRFFKSFLNDLNWIIGTILSFTPLWPLGAALIASPVHLRLDNGKLGISVAISFGANSVGFKPGARAPPPRSIGGAVILYQTAADAALPWLPSWDTAAKVLLPGYLAFSEAERAFRDGRAVDALAWLALGATEIGLTVYTLGVSHAVIASSRAGNIAVNQAARTGAATLRSQTASNFRTNLGRLTGRIPAGADAHHVFPQAFAATFERAGLNIHDPRFGAWWEARTHRANAGVYNQLRSDFLTTGQRSADEILQFGRSLGERFGFPVWY